MEGAHYDILEVIGKLIHLVCHHADLIGPIHFEADTEVALPHLADHLHDLPEGITDGPGGVEGNGKAET
ncbi:MAG: hypothetical protein A4E62_01477 [Syntrophorhabdus sp. PtaU1.Bin002]|nr:MAG: hypothetical protein A4E62_01477 [Syntrophorhabdus sp. PtaU1.Bin002]